MDVNQSRVSHYRVILASGSPRRRQLLGDLGLEFEVILPHFQEELFDFKGLSPSDIVLQLSKLKGQSVANELLDNDILVIAADTIVVIDQQVLGKPSSAVDAQAMLSKLQGRWHEVWTGTSVFLNGQCVSQALMTRVLMKPLSNTEIETYVETKESLDKAGAYAIQGIGSLLVERIEGCYFNVVGLSLHGLNELTTSIGVPLLINAICV